jgi:hypothetical protein
MNISNTASIITIDHQKIREWIEKYKGKPAFITCPGGCQEIQGLRIDFEDKEDEKYLTSARKSKVVNWSAFFKEFERLNLAFIYNPTLRRNPDMLYRFIKRENVTELEETPNPKTVPPPFVHYQASLGIFQNGSVETPVSAYEMFLSTETPATSSPSRYRF